MFPFVNTALHNFYALSCWMTSSFFSTSSRQLHTGLAILMHCGPSHPPDAMLVQCIHASCIPFMELYHTSIRCSVSLKNYIFFIQTIFVWICALRIMATLLHCRGPINISFNLSIIISWIIRFIYYTFYTLRWK